ncbi:hypothetical protein FJV76_14345 [Mesorhizobium sp. WSM4303]|uniref:hypothetical protein n=1 Tax=Mesorhizobium sp. WSM4303 TaxID=2589887 RepID=UPI00115C4A82|nr:hypothetical protein [Mesorhizobium sp. WSM4303]TRD03812.1 hypothetical protein FJV76_14345 [Mesorhizobium sp. WSM4303]
MSEDTGILTFTSSPAAGSVYFNGANQTAMLILTQDGRLEIGEGLSEDEVTRHVATMLAELYSTLHREQAEEIARLKVEIAALSNSKQKESER